MRILHAGLTGALLIGSAAWAAAPAPAPSTAPSPDIAGSAFDWHPSENVDESAPAPKAVPTAAPNLPPGLTNPAVRGFVKIFGDPRVVLAVDKFTRHPNRWRLLGLDIALMFTIYVLRAWRMAKADSRLARFQIKLYSLLAIWGIGGLTLPVMMVGDAYLNLIRALVVAAFGK